MGVVVSPGLVLQWTSQFRRLSPWVLWQNKVTYLNVSVSSAEPTHPATNLSNPQTSSYWVADTLLETTLLVEGLVGTIDAVGIARHNFGSNQSTVSIEAVTADSAPDFVVLASAAPGSDDPLLFKLPPDSYSAVRVRVSESSGEAHRAAVLSVGQLMVIPTGISPSYTPIGDSSDIELSEGFSQRGEYLGGWVLSSGLQTQTTISELTDTWYRQYMRPFLDYANRGGTFFWAWSPNVRPTDIAYCWFPGRSARAAISRTRPLWTVDMTMSGVDL